MPGASQIAIVILHGRLLFGPKPNKEIRFWYQVWFQAYMYAKARACSITQFRPCAFTLTGSPRATRYC